MKDITQIAKTCHAVHRAYCKQMGIETQPVWDEVSESHKDVIINSVLKILSGEINSKEESHFNFVMNKEAQGWKFGIYSKENKTNPRLLPFEELRIEDQVKETLFFETVKSFI